MDPEASACATAALGAAIIDLRPPQGQRAGDLITVIDSPTGGTPRSRCSSISKRCSTEHTAVDLPRRVMVNICAEHRQVDQDPVELRGSMASAIAYTCSIEATGRSAGRSTEAPLITHGFRVTRPSSSAVAQIAWSN